MTVGRFVSEYLQSKGFERSLVKAYLRFEVLSEGGLRDAVSRLLRQKLLNFGPAEKLEYRVSSENFLFRSKPDITVWRMGKPSICIELKDTPYFVDNLVKSDWEKLRSCVSACNLRAGYFIYVARRDSDKHHFGVSRTNAHRKLIPIPIILERAFESMNEDFDSWDSKYKGRVKYGRDK